MLRPFRLLRVALEAEGLRWRRTGRGLAIRAGLGAGAALFALLLLLMLHGAAWAYLSRDQDPAIAALMIAGGDLAVLALLAFLASRESVDPIAIEAERIRNDAFRQVGETTAKAAMLAPLLRSGSLKKGLLGAAVTAVAVGLIARR
jgi:hypothetical protein